MNERLQLLAEQFFERILASCPSKGTADFVVVTHLLEDRPWFLRAVSRLGRVVAVIPKRKSVVPHVRDILKHRYKLLDLQRSDIDTPDAISAILGPCLSDRPICILDIGGYFEAATLGVQGIALAGIVEDTENGHAKYQARLERGAELNHIAIASVARSGLKRPENFLVGQSLVYSVEAILREMDELLHGRRACVIGYGNIGRSVAQHLHERHVEVTVYDRDPAKLIEAFTHGFRTAVSGAEAVSEVDIVFCVTGNRSIGLRELEAMRPHTYVATVTSPDDEFDPEVLRLTVTHRPKHISECVRPDGSVVFMMNRGQAVNFLHGSVVGPFIQLLQAEILVTASKLLSGEIKPKPGQICTIDRSDQDEIARVWLLTYRHR